MAPLCGCFARVPSRRSDEVKSKSGSGSSEERVNLETDENTSLQVDMWRLSFRAKIESGAAPKDYPLYKKLAEAGSYDASLKLLSDLYASHGLSKRIPKIKVVLDSVRPFVDGVTVMVQSNPHIAALVWGGVVMVFQLVERTMSVFETFSSMLSELSSTLPALQAFADTLKTPRLHSALRDIYDVYVDFCLVLIKALGGNKCALLLRIHISTLEAQSKASKRDLAQLVQAFDREAHLAGVQIDERRHQEIMDHLTPEVSKKTLLVGLQARNSIFTGRERSLGILENLMLTVGPGSTAGRRSCAIHAIGGMGKTQIAREFVYRHLGHYKSIFWARAETSTVLVESFLQISEKVGGSGAGESVEKRVRSVKDFLAHSDDWLLIYDNVVSANDINDMLPAGNGGSIIITTQDPQLNQITSTELALTPMDPQDGSLLIRKHLRRGGSEQEESERLSKELGGLPLAIAHFAGFAAKSQCSVEQIAQSLRDRRHSSQIWSQTDLTTLSSYEQTLNTVWDLALRRLESNPDAKTLLEIIAFLEPDMMPEDMFVGPGIEGEEKKWEYWDHQRFNSAVGVLRERNLIERFIPDKGGFLRTHRALQRHILHQLDTAPEHRKSIFYQAVDIIRQAFPAPNYKKKGDTAHWDIWKTYVPHVISLNTSFAQSWPQMRGRLDFAELLEDTATFLHNWHVRDEAIALLHTAHDICASLASKDTTPKELLRVRALVESDLALYDQKDGVFAVDRGIERTSNAIKWYEERFFQLTEDEKSKDEWILLSSLYIDCSACLFGKEEMQQAEHHVLRAMDLLRKAGTQEDLAVRYGMWYMFNGIVLSGKQDHESAVKSLQEGYDITARTLGPDHFFSLFVRFPLAVGTFVAGDTAGALLLHEEILESRCRLHEEGHDDILTSQYHVAVCQHRLGDVEAAEDHLRKILEWTKVTRKWREEDVARVEYRLAIVLRQQRKLREATSLAERALERRAKWETVLLTQESGAPKEPGEYQDMVLFDRCVSIWHGRTSGIWARNDLDW